MKKLLIVLGFPVWFPILISLFAVMLSISVSFWAVFVSVLACGVAGVIACIGYAALGYQLFGFALLGTGLVCLGFSIPFFFIAKVITKCVILLPKKMICGN